MKIEIDIKQITSAIQAKQVPAGNSYSMSMMDNGTRKPKHQARRIRRRDDEVVVNGRVIRIH